MKESFTTQTNRMFWKNRIVFVLLLFVSVFGYVVFSDAVNTSYTEFYFVSGVNHYTTMLVNLTGGETGNVDFYLENKSDADINMNISFVDSEIINFGSTGVRVCKSENEKDKFGNYVSMPNNTFVLAAGANTTETLDLLFPAWYSGVYLGCVVYYPTVTEDDDHLNTVARKAIFLDVDVVPTNAVFEVKVYPQNRNSFTNANNAGFNNSGKVLFYASGDRTTPIASGYVGTNYDGTGTYIGDIPSGYYDVVYKGWQQLSSYISGIYITGGQEILLDFTTGVNLYGVKAGLSFNGTSGYQEAGDLTNASNHQDNQILVADLSILYGSACGYGDPGNYTLKCDVNHDGAVDSSDAPSIIENMFDEDLAYGSIPLFGGFGLSNY